MNQLPKSQREEWLPMETGLCTFILRRDIACTKIYPAAPKRTIGNAFNWFRVVKIDAMQTHSGNARRCLYGIGKRSDGSGVSRNFGGAQFATKEATVQQHCI
jgi:hypothetical protein